MHWGHLAHEQTALRANLRRLGWVRLAGVSALAGLMVPLAGTVDLDLRPQWLAAVGGVGVLVALLTLLRCRMRAAVQPVELTAQLVADIVLLTLAFRASGGAANPCVSVFLIPVVLAATLLPRWQAWSLAVLACAGYSALLWDYSPRLIHHHHPGAPAQFDLHVVGMWGNFVLSTVVIAVAVTGMGEALRLRDRRLARAREDILRNEQILGLATLAAGAAHELGTPLATMAVVTRELECEAAATANAPPGQLADLRILRSQVDLCKQIIQRMLSQNPPEVGPGAPVEPLAAFLAGVLDQWRLMRPHTPLVESWTTPPPGPEVVLPAHPGLAQALVNVLNNAADASPAGIALDMALAHGWLTLQVLDEGSGPPGPLVSGLAGRSRMTTKQASGGSGLGLLLTSATLERLGGTVDLAARPGGGACTTIRLPLARLQAPDHGAAEGGL